MHVRRSKRDQVVLIGGIASVRCGLYKLGSAFTVERGPAATGAVMRLALSDDG